MQLNKLGQLTYAGCGQRISWQQWILWIARLNVFEHDLGLTQSLVTDLEERDFAQGRLLQKRWRAIGPDEFFFKRHGFFEQRELDLVVIIAGGETTKNKH